MNEWKHMYRVKVVWLTENEGGRRSAPPIGRYYPVSRFPEEKTDWQNNAWSVVFELEKPNVTDGRIVSMGKSRRCIIDRELILFMSDYLIIFATSTHFQEYKCVTKNAYYSC